MYLYIRYENKKALLAANKDHVQPVERMLWHGTSETSVDGINRNGFNKILMGKNGKKDFQHYNMRENRMLYGRLHQAQHLLIMSCVTVSATWYGEGTYLAVNAHYSHSYARPNDAGIRNMYYCRCLTGDYIESNEHTRMAPQKEGWVAYDTTVNRQVDPVMFIVYDADQVYPQYLIKYSDWP